MIAMGCDIGSLFAKAAVLEDDRLRAARIVRTTGNIGREIDALLDATLADAALTRRDLDLLVGAGAGARAVPGAAFCENETTCLAAACAYFLPDVRLLIDIGGQSITALLLDDEGEIASLMRNDKCASGSGRFLEMMSRKLLVDIADIDAVVDRAAAPVSISNQCAVFAESEAISHVNENETPADILAGICQAVANIVAAQCRRFGLADHYTITGGVARFRAVTDRLGDKLSGAHRRFPFDPRLATAIGAALLLDED